MEKKTPKNTKTPAAAGPVPRPAGPTIYPGTAVSDLLGIITEMQGSRQHPRIDLVSWAFSTLAYLPLVVQDAA